VYYQGAVVAKMKLDYTEVSEDGQITLKSPENSGPTEKMSLSDAMKKVQGGSSDDLDALNHESESAFGGSLFERVTVPTN
jgi:hypothetical protein